MTTFTLTLAPVGDGPAVELRIRALLKTALRRHRLRCLGIEIENPRQTHQDEREGDGMGCQSALASNASEGRKNASNRPSGQERTAGDTATDAARRGIAKNRKTPR